MLNKKILVLGIAFTIFTSNEIMASPIESVSRAQVSNFTGFTNNMIYIESYNTNKVTNSTDQPLHIVACYGISVNNCGRNQERCFKVTVNPHGTWQDHWQPNKTCLFKYAANYNIRAYSTVYGDAKSSYDAFAAVIVR